MKNVTYPFKHWSHILLLVLFLPCLAACSGGGEDEPTPAPKPDPQPTLTITSSVTAPVLEQKGGTAEVEFTSSTAWTASVSEGRAASWITVAPTSGPSGKNTLTVTTTENTTTDERNATVTLKAGTTTKSFTVSQKQKDALTVTSNKVEVGAEGGAASIEVKSNVNYEYEIEEAAQSWITVNKSRAMKTTTIDLQIAENEDTAKREGKITIKSGELSEVVTVYQEGSKPSIVLTQNEYAVSSAGETIKMELRSNVDYTVQMPAESWITESTSRAFSSHTHYFTVAANDTYDARSAVITFINKENGIEEKVTVTQVQQDAIVVAQTEYTLSAKGGKLDFVANTNVDFTVEVSADWIKQITSRGLTEKPLHFDVAENTEEEAREATITLASGDVKQVVTVKQTGKDVFSIAQKEYSLTSDGGNIEVSVVSTGEYTVQMPGVDWISEVKSKAVTTTHTFAIAKNGTHDARQAEIVFTHKESGVTEKVTVLQAQLDAIVVAENTYHIAAAGGPLDFVANTNVDFTVTVSADWIKQVTSRGLTEKPLHFDVAENPTDEAREATITLAAGDVKQVITVKQASTIIPYINVNQTKYNINAEGETITIIAESNVEIDVIIPQKWIRISDRYTDGQKEYIILDVFSKYTIDSRTATITLSNEKYGISKEIEVEQTSNNTESPYMIPLGNGMFYINNQEQTIWNGLVNTNVDFEVKCDADWIRAEFDGYDYSYNVMENKTGQARMAVITCHNEKYGLSVSFKINQSDETGIGSGSIDELPTEEW